MNDYTANNLCRNIKSYIDISKAIQGNDEHAALVLRFILERIEVLIGEAQ